MLKHDEHKDFYKKMGAKLDTRFVADFNICTDGELICFSMLTAKLTNNRGISCVLIQNNDDDYGTQLSSYLP